MKELAILIINCISLFFLGILRYVSTRIGPAPVDDAQQIEQHPMPAFYVQYRQYLQFTAGWLDEYWPVISRWTHTFLNCFHPHDAGYGPQLGPRNQGPRPIPVMVVPRPPPPAHHED